MSYSGFFFVVVVCFFVCLFVFCEQYKVCIPTESYKIIKIESSP